MSDPREMAQQGFTLLQEALNASEARAAEVSEHIEGLEAEFARQNDAAQQRIATLETDLTEERECTAKLSEVANERRELAQSLEERLEEAQEHYEEASWRLGKAEHFERLVRRRKSLIESLIGALRTRNKTNTALKAGLDGLRTFKANSEANHHQVLGQLDTLKARIKELEEAPLPRPAQTGVTDGIAERLESAQKRITELEERLHSQAEVVQELEQELKAAQLLMDSEATRSSAVLHKAPPADAVSETDVRSTSANGNTRLQQDHDDSVSAISDSYRATGAL